MGARLLRGGALLAAIALGTGLAAAAAEIGAGRPLAPAVQAPWAAPAAPEPVVPTGPGATPAPLPALERGLLREAERQAQERWLRERLGGLAALVVDPASTDLAACVPERLAGVPAGEDPADVARAMTTLRGLDFDEPVQPELLAPEDMAERVAEAFAPLAEDEELEIERRLLAALGAVPADIDLREVRVEAFAEQVSGLHSGARGEVLLRVGDPARLSPLERVVLAHELEHALTYQQLGRPSRARDRAEDADEQRASAAVVEGSATLAMLHYARATLDDRERLVLRRELVARAREGALEDHTPYLLAELQYPYTEGLRFACERFAAGGWEAVDAAYAAPPSSSAEILFPQRYARGEEPLAPPPLAEPDDRWEPVHDEVLGAADLLWLLEAPGGRPEAALGDARARVAAWAGGRVRVWVDGPSTVVGVSLAQRPGEWSLCATVRAWQRAGWQDEARSVEPGTVLYAGTGRAVAVGCGDGGVRLGVASEPEAALAVLGAGFPQF